MSIPKWDFTGSAMLYSVDSGQSWSLLFDDLTDPIQIYLYRGAHWALQKYSTPYPGSETYVNEAWLVATDYRLPNADFGQTTEAVGGRIFVTRIKRIPVNGGIPPWTSGDSSAKAALFDMDDITPSGVHNSRHAHSGAIIKQGSTGVRLVVALGDEQCRHRFMTAVLSSHTGHYTSTGTGGDWSIADGYYGRGQLLSPPDPPGVDDGVYCPQSVAVLPADKYLTSPGDPRAIFLGADNTCESISMITCPDSGQPTIAHTFGGDTGFNTPVGAGEGFRWPSVFQLRAQAPDLGSPIVALSGDGGINSARYWYQPGAGDSDSLGLWANILTTRYSSNGWALPFGDKIIVGGQDSSEPSLSYRSKPSPDGSTGSKYIRQRPLVLSPGGKNMFKSSFEAPFVPTGSRHTLSVLGHDSGGWFDLDSSNNPVHLDPQPPILGGTSSRVLKIKTRQSTDNLIGLLWPSTTDHTSSANQTSWVTSAQLRQFRFYVINNSSGSLANQTQPSTALLSMALQNDDSTSGGTSSRGRVSNLSRWVPHTLAYGGFPSGESITGPRILLRCVESTTANDGYYYVACDVAKDGETCLGYPQPPEQNGPNELLVMTGFGLQGSFTLLVAGMMPEDDWNHLTPRSGNYRPLFTLWSDTNNWIEFGAYASGGSGVDTGRFRLRIKAAGTLLDPFDWPRDVGTGNLVEDIYWSRGSQLLIGFSYNASTHKLDVCASLGGDPPRRGSRTQGQELPTPVFSTGFNFDSLLFSGASGEVTTFRWFGGKAVAGTAMIFDDMSDQLVTLEFLTT